MLAKETGGGQKEPIPDDYCDKYPYYEETVTESDWHFEAQEALRFALTTRYADRDDVYVASNMFVYYEEGDATKKVSPDTFVVFGVPRRKHKSFRIWEEGAGPAVVFEFTSESSRVTDRGTKRALYEMMGVKEYFLFDPLGEYIPGQLKGYRLEGGELLPLVGKELISEQLGVRLVPDEHFLSVYDLESNERYLRFDELRHAKEKAEEARQDAEEARQDAEEARQDAEEARLESDKARREAEARARALEEEVRRLRAQLES